MIENLFFINKLHFKQNEQSKLDVCYVPRVFVTTVFFIVPLNLPCLQHVLKHLLNLFNQERIQILKIPSILPFGIFYPGFIQFATLSKHW